MKKPNILVLTNSFPNAFQPHRGIYIKQILDKMKTGINPVVVCPLPWFPNLKTLKKYKEWYFYARIPSLYKWDGYQVHCPKYVLLPKFSTTVNSLPMTVTLLRTLKKLSPHTRIDAIHAHNIFPEGVAAVFLGKHINVPVILSGRGSDINKVTEEGKVRLWQTIWAIKNAQNLTAVSRPLCEIMSRIGANGKKVYYIPNGVNKDRFFQKDKVDCRGRLGIDPEKKILLFVGKFRKVKGLHYLVKALEMIKSFGKLDFETVLIGTGRTEKELREVASNCHLDGKIFFQGNLTHDQIPDWMGASDLFCLPSLNEGMPNVVIEALSSGLPVVASKVGGIPDLINNDNGIMVPPGNEKLLASAIIIAFKRRWDSKRIVNSVANLSWNESGSKYIEVIKKTIEAWKI